MTMVIPNSSRELPGPVRLPPKRAEQANVSVNSSLKRLRGEGCRLGIFVPSLHN